MNLNLIKKIGIAGQTFEDFKGKYLNLYDEVHDRESISSR